MSHNVEVEGVEFKDLNILEQAVNELVKEGAIQAEFRKGGNVTIRGWRGGAGENIRYGIDAWDREMNHQCEAGIIFPNEKYDVGFNKKEDGSLVPFIESSWNCPLRADADAERCDGGRIDTSTSHALPGGRGAGGQVGKLAQRYAIIMAERNARINGLATRRVKAGRGQIQLVVRS